MYVHGTRIIFRDEFDVPASVSVNLLNRDDLSLLFNIDYPLYKQVLQARRSQLKGFWAIRALFFIEAIFIPVLFLCSLVAIDRGGVIFIPFLIMHTVLQVYRIRSGYYDYLL